MANLFEDREMAPPSRGGNAGCTLKQLKKRRGRTTEPEALKPGALVKHVRWIDDGEETWKVVGADGGDVHLEQVLP